MNFPDLTDLQAIHDAVQQVEREEGLGTLTPEDFRTLSERVDARWPAELDRVRFRPQQVEELLDQAADLLDRALKERASWDDLYEKWFSVQLALHEAAAVDVIQRAEQSARVFEIESETSLGEAQAASAGQDALEITRRAAQVLRDAYSEDAFTARQNTDADLARWSVWAQQSNVVTTHRLGEPDRTLGEWVWREAVMAARGLD